MCSKLPVNVQNEYPFQSLLFLLEVYLNESEYTVISGKAVGKNVHGTIPKGNNGFDQYTVPNDCSCQIYFSCFSLALANITSQTSLSFFQISLKNSALKTTTVPVGIVACTFSDNLSRNSCMHFQSLCSCSIFQL